MHTPSTIGRNVLQRFQLRGPLSEIVSHSTIHGVVPPTTLVTSTHCWFNVYDSFLTHDIQQYCSMKVFCVADVHWEKRDERGCLQREGSARLLPRLESKRASATVGWCERCFGKNEWRRESLQPLTNLELQLSCAALAHRMNIDIVWNILGPMLLLKQT